MNRTRPAERHECVFARVTTFLSKMHARRSRHRFINDALHAQGGIHLGNIEFSCNFFSESSTHAVDIEVHFAAKEVIRVKTTEDEISTSNRWLTATARIATRHRLCACSARTNSHQY